MRLRVFVKVLGEMREMWVICAGGALGEILGRCAHLGDVNDGGREERSEDAAVSNGEGASSQVLDSEAAGLGLGAEVDDILLDVGKGHVLHPAEHRRHQALGCRDRDRDVDVVTCPEAWVQHSWLAVAEATNLRAD